MKNLISSFAVVALLFSSALLLGQTRDVGNFDSVYSSTSVSVTLVKASAPSVEFTMKKGSARNLITEVKNGTLYVKTKSMTGNWSNNNTKADVTVYYTDLEEIRASAGCTVKSDNTIEANSMEIEVSSGSTAILDIKANKIKAEATSGSTLKLKGQAHKGNFEANSGATLNASRFVTEDAVAEASSGASLSIHVDNSFEAVANSGASIKYSGNVKNENVDTGWSGSIKRKK